MPVITTGNVPKALMAGTRKPKAAARKLGQHIARKLGWKMPKKRKGK